MELQILTPESLVFSGKISSVKLPGSADKGSFQVLPGHAPLISSLQAGLITIETPEGKRDFNISGGFVEVLNDKVAVMVEGVE